MDDFNMQSALHQHL